MLIKTGITAEAERRKAIDWEQIEQDYRAGVISVRALAEGHGIAHVTIHQRAKRQGWIRDLSAQIRIAAQAKLAKLEANATVESEETNKVIREPSVVARETIDRGSDQIVSVVREHRRDIASQRTLVRQLLDELQESSDNQDVLEDEIAQEEDGRRRATLRRAVALPSRAIVMSNLAQALKILIGLEREAFGIDGQHSMQDPMEKWVKMTSIELRAEIESEIIALGFVEIDLDQNGS